MDPTMRNSTQTHSPPSPSSLRAPFRFKSTASRSHPRSPPAHPIPSHSSNPPIDLSGNADGVDGDELSTHSRRKHSHKRKRRSKSDSTPKDHALDMDPEIAFRESLFDAMADDEGAQFWAQVYATPVETFNQSFLQHMTEEEYAAYVRTQMWQRTPEYIQIEKQRKEQDRTAAKVREEEDLKAARRRKKKANRWEKEKEEIKSDWGKHRDDWDNEVDAVLRKRVAKRVDWEGAWKRYLLAWDDLSLSEEDRLNLRNDSFPAAAPRPLQFLLPYPVLSSFREDVTPDAVSGFLQNCPSHLLPGGLNASSSKDPLAQPPSPSSPSVPSRSLHKMREVESVLKAERLRWHPDKIQQRFGPKYSTGVDVESMKVVTEVFQIVDALLCRIKVKLEDGSEGGERKRAQGSYGPHRYW